MRIIATFLLAFFITIAWSQTVIKGVVNDQNGAAIPGVNVFVKGSFDGGTSNKNGAFYFKTDEQGKQMLVASFIGFETAEIFLDIKGTEIEVNVVLQEKVSEMEAVTVTAGSFEASDEKKAVMLKPIDIVTVANSVGDIMAAMGTLPGAQRSGQDGLLVVRGGDGTETKTFIDGTCVEKPYTSHMPDLPSRGRFSPMLFKGTMFSTGGFSAQYGQALSSVVQLESMGLAEKTQGGISLMSVGFGGSISYRADSASFTSEMTYANMSPYYALTGSKTTWTRDPRSFSNVFTLRQKMGTRGMLKTMVQASHSASGMLYANLDSGNDDTVTLGNSNIYINSSYQSPVGKNSTINVSTGGMYDDDRLSLGALKLDTRVVSASEMLWMKHFIGKQTLKYGVQVNEKMYQQRYKLDTIDARLNFDQPLVAAFVETEFYLTQKILLKPGLRSEYSVQNNEHNVQPRVSAAYKTSGHGQVSLAWGIFRQLQADDHVKFNASLHSSQALQYIANYQWEHNNRLFRTELYAKQYTKLVKYTSLNNPDPSSYSTSGTGYAYGVDAFFRDTKTVVNGDFWLSYSFIETRRNYKDYREMAQPDYVSPHCLSVVYKQFFPKIQTQFGLSYIFASSKRYNNPNQGTFMASRLPSTNDLSLSFSYLTRVWGKLAIVHGSVSNILGFSDVYGYRFASQPAADGSFKSLPITPLAKRMVFLGIFVNI